MRESGARILKCSVFPTFPINAMPIQQFIAKWQRVNLSERSACERGLLDLCELLGQLKSAEPGRFGGK